MEVAAPVWTAAGCKVATDVEPPGTTSTAGRASTERVEIRTEPHKYSTHLTISIDAGTN